jgi:carbamoyl-phosphate synthase large subunit
MSMQNKRIFVSGGAGVIGKALVDLLISQGAEIFVGDLKPCPKQWIGKIQYRQGDLNTIPLQELSAFNPELVFHLAAAFERSEEQYSFFSENFHHNVQLSHHLLAHLKECSALQKFIFASSYLIYDPSLYQFESSDNSGGILTETSAISPRNLCGAAKLFHELELHFLDRFLGPQLSAVSARIFRVYGRGSKDVISRWIRAALRQEKIDVYCLEGKFDYIFADDVAQGLVELSKTHCSGIVNLGFGCARSIREVLDILHEYFPDLKIELQQTKISFENSQASIEKLVELTQWQPPHSLEKAIPKLIEFEKNELSTAAADLHENRGVLITSLSKKIPQIQAIRQAAEKLGQFKQIHGCDSDPYCIGKYAVNEFWHCPRLSELTPGQIIAYCHERKITAIIPTRDEDLTFYSQHLMAFLKAGIHVMVSNYSAIKTCQDKKEFADFLVKKHFPAIPTALSIAEIAEPRYVVKERIGAGSLHVGLNLSAREAEEYSRRLNQPIFQPYIQGKEWSVDLYRTKDKQILGAVARERNLIVQGESQITTTRSYPQLEALCFQIADQIDLYGHAVFQVLVDPQGHFHVIECNLRFGGASTASLAVGLDSFFWFFAESLGLNLNIHPFKRSSQEIRQIRYPTDKVIPWSSSST